VNPVQVYLRIISPEDIEHFGKGEDLKSFSQRGRHGGEAESTVIFPVALPFLHYENLLTSSYMQKFESYNTAKHRTPKE